MYLRVEKLENTQAYCITFSAQEFPTTKADCGLQKCNNNRFREPRQLALKCTMSQQANIDTKVTDPNPWGVTGSWTLNLLLSRYASINSKHCHCQEFILNEF